MHAGTLLALLHPLSPYILFEKSQEKEGLLHEKF